MKKILLFLLILPAAAACGTQRKIERLNREQTGASIALSRTYEADLPELHVDKQGRDTLHVVDIEGKKVLIMNAVRDEDGEMVATDRIQAAVVTARFRNIAERNGKVDLRFEVRIPASLRDKAWQLRLYPDLFVLGDSTRLDPVLVTGKDYRDAQMKGYRRYQRFIDSIITDTTRFIRRHQLEVFIARNLPLLHALKDSDEYISDEEYRSIFGVDEEEAVRHYTIGWLIRRNNRRIAMKDKMFHKYVKAPIITEGLRIDTVLTADNGDFVYEYVQTLRTRPGLSKANVMLSGEIFEEDRRIYTVPRSGPLTFYISSLASLAEPAERYITTVIERNVEENSVCWIDFAVGKADINPGLSNNYGEMARIKDNLAQLLENPDFDIDSITVTASCSPEGSYAQNRMLADRRAATVSDYFGAFIRHYSDSLRHSSFNLDDCFSTSAPPEIRFLSRGNPENWTMLQQLVERDSLLSVADKDAVAAVLPTPDPDLRERALQALPSYRHLRETVYPRLRTVGFRFYLHRRGMVKDTIHTTVTDTLYEHGVAALKDHDYQRAVTLLRPYKDFNAALACSAMEYNHSALAILEALPDTPKAEYLRAVLYSREGDDQAAVQHYLNAVRADRSFIFRGNLDPEIAVLISKYGLNTETEEED